METITQIAQICFTWWNGKDGSELKSSCIEQDERVLLYFHLTEELKLTFLQDPANSSSSNITVQCTLGAVEFHRLRIGWGTAPTDL